MQTAQIKPGSPRKRLTGHERIALEIADFRREAKLDSWASFVEALQVPNDLAVALMTGRHELVKAAQPRALTIEECATLYKLIAGLVETNAALREHTERVAILTNRLNDALTGFASTAQSINDFANFRVTGESGDDALDQERRR
jgi:hypothetical protein